MLQKCRGEMLQAHNISILAIPLLRIWASSVPDLLTHLHITLARRPTTHSLNSGLLKSSPRSLSPASTPPQVLSILITLSRLVHDPLTTHHDRAYDSFFSHFLSFASCWIVIIFFQCLLACMRPPNVFTTSPAHHSKLVLLDPLPCLILIMSWVLMHPMHSESYSQCYFVI